MLKDVKGCCRCFKPVHAVQVEVCVVFTQTMCGHSWSFVITCLQSLTLEICRRGAVEWLEADEAVFA